MTLLERFDKYGMGASLDEIDPEKVREAIAVAQAVGEAGKLTMDIAPETGFEMHAWIMDRADELLRGEGPCDGPARRGDSKDLRKENSAYGAWLRGEGKQ